MKTCLAVLVLSLCCAFPAAAGTLDELTPYFSTQYFTWREYTGGRRILQERGALFSLGAVFDGNAGLSSLTLRGRGELFGGKVGYDGETQAPESLPVHTRVGYFGTREELDLGYRAARGAEYLEPFVGVGHRWWLRALQDSTAENGTPVSGYTEVWQTLYGRVGGRGKVEFSERTRLLCELGAKYPLYTGNSVDFAGSGKTTFYPRARWSGFAEASFGYENVRFSLLYEGFRFAQSHTKQVQERLFFQPASSSDIFGVRLGWSFR